MKRRIVYALAALGVFAISQQAQASLPVPYEVVGCVKGSDFTSQGRTLPIRPEKQMVDLAAYEGKTVEITGFLSPGDRLSVGEVRVVAPDCQASLHRSKFLCNPCKTR